MIFSGVRRALLGGARIMDSTWAVDANGNWSTSSNWTNGVPNGIGAIARFGTILSTGRTITLDSAFTIGQLYHSAPGNNTLQTSTLTLDNGKFGSSLIMATNTGDPTISSAIVMVSPLIINLASGANVTMSGVVSGANRFIKTGAGTLTFSAANTYTGGFTLSGGIMSMFSDSRFGAVPGGVVSDYIKLDSGRLNITGTHTLNSNRGITLTADSSISVSAAAVLTYGGIIAGSFGLTYGVSGATGQATITGANTYTGATTVAFGVLNIQHATALGTSGSGTTVNDATALQIQGSITVTGETLSLVGQGISADGALRSISGTNVWTGNLTIAAGATTRIGSDAGTLTISGNIALSSTTSDELRLQGAGALVVSGIISGASKVTRGGTGGGTVTLSGANTYTGKTSVGGTALSIASFNSVSGGTASSSIGAPTTVGNGTIDFGSTTTPVELIYTGSGETTDRVLNLSGTTFNATLTHSGTGLLKFTSALTATGSGIKALILSGSTAGTGEIAGAIVDSGGGATDLTKSGTGTWTISGLTTYSGTTTVSAGTFIETGGRTVSGNTIYTGGGTVDRNGGTYTGITDWLQNITMNVNAATINYNAGRPMIGYSGTTIMNVQHASAVIVQTNTANPGFIGRAGFTGTLNFSLGTMTLTSDFYLGFDSTANSKGIFNLNGGTFNMTTKTIYVNRQATASTGAGTWTISSGTADVLGISFGDGSTFTAGSAGTLNVSGGTLYIGTGGIVKSAAGTLTDARNFSGGTIGATNDWSSSLDITLTNTVTFKAATAAAASKNITLSGVLSSTGALTKTGAGTLILSGTNTYTGATTVSAGILQVTGSTASGSAVTVSGGTLNGTGTVSGTVTVANVASSVLMGGTGTGNTGTLTTGALTFSGSTASVTVNTNGTTTISLVTSTGAVTLGSVTVNFNGALDAGTYTIIGGASMSGTATQGTVATGRTWTSLTVVGNNLVAVLA